MTATSRPLRAAGAVVGGWIVLRTAMLWNAMPQTLEFAASGLSDRLVNSTSTAPLDPVLAPAPTAPSNPRLALTVNLEPEPPSPAKKALSAAAAHTPQLSLTAELPTPTPAAARRLAEPPAPPQSAPATDPPAYRSGMNRLSLSSWAIVRGAASSGGLAPGGVLGGSQAGARLWITPGPPGLTLTARVSTPLGVRTGSEVSAGIGIRKGSFGVIVEERISLDTGQARPSVTAFGGVSDLRLAGKLRLDGYAQAGIVGLRNRIGFVDGAVRIEHPVAGRAVKIAIGAGVWGGAQPGLARLDAGPQLVARLPVFGGTLRVAGEYRFRVAGQADPGSGPALSVGADF